MPRSRLAWPALCLPRELLGGPQAWPLLLATCLVPGVLQLASLPLLPESPRYLLIDRGDTKACVTGESLPLGPQATLDPEVHLICSFLLGNLRWCISAGARTHTHTSVQGQVDDDVLSVTMAIIRTPKEQSHKKISDLK